MNSGLLVRLKREIELLHSQPPEGVACWPKENNIKELEGNIIGPSGTPYEGGSFHLSIDIPDRYPFEPPKIKFLTKVYHPNIDSSGRICLDTLVMPPKGAWTPSLNIASVLVTLRALLAAPNPKDPLMADIVFK